MHRSRTKALAPVTLAIAAVVLSACGRDNANLINGKTQFANKCGSCHQLARAGTKGTQGPNLDAAFKADRQAGMTAKTVKGVVVRQIAHPRRGSIMPAGLVKGKDANDVAAYVGFVAGIGGMDTGPLAQAGKPKTSSKPAIAKGGKLTIDAIEGTAFTTTAAQAPAGQLTVSMTNRSSIVHNIELKGVAGAKGKVVGKGGLSTFTISLKPGKYTYICAVPGHEQAGMKGTLTVK